MFTPDWTPAASKAIDLSTPLQELLSHCRLEESHYREGERERRFNPKLAQQYKELADGWKSRGDALEALLAEFGLGK